jgi:hypothetical protein
MFIYPALFGQLALELRLMSQPEQATSERDALCLERFLQNGKVLENSAPSSLSHSTSPRTLNYVLNWGTCSFKKKYDDKPGTENAFLFVRWGFKTVEIKPRSVNGSVSHLYITFMNM